MSERYGVTFPLEGMELRDQRVVAEALPDLGYTDAWSLESEGTDGFTPLALASVWAPRLRLGVAIIPVFTRGPATIAISAATLASIAPGRFALGVGSSSQTVVERWNGLPFERPYERVRDTVRFLRKAFAGERIDEAFETFTVRGFRSSLVPSPPPAILVAALRPAMLRMAGREGDGAILTWLSADDVRTVVPHVLEAGGSKEIVARIVVAPTADSELVRSVGRQLIATYLNVPVYARFHEWLGRGDRLAPMWKAWGDGDRAAALAAVPDDVIDDLIIHGPPEHCREQVARYVEHGVTTPVLSVLRFGRDPIDVLRDLGPR